MKTNLSEKSNKGGLLARAFYEREGSTAARYNSTSFWERRYHLRKASLVLTSLKLHLQPNFWILDAGCGSGEMSIASKNLGGKVISLDLSKSYLRRVYNKTDHLICASTDCLPLKSGIFEIVLSTDVLEHICSYEESISEIHRVSKNLVIITTPCEGLLRRIFGCLFPDKLAEIDFQVGHLHIIPLMELRKKLSKLGAVLYCRSFHVVQPLADRIIPVRLEKIIAFLEQVGNSLLPNQGTISFFVLKRANTLANESLKLKKQ